MIFSYRQFVVNEHALDEAATRLKNALRSELLFRALAESGLSRFERVPEEVFGRAANKFVEWDDNDASFAHFVVACHVEAIGVDYVATYDRYYRLFDVVTTPYVEFE